jgi:hypothetical protein
MTVLPIERRLELLIEKARAEPSRVPSLMKALIDAPLVVPSMAPPEKLRAFAAAGKTPDLHELFPLPTCQTSDADKTRWAPIFTSRVLLEEGVTGYTGWGRVRGQDLCRMLLASSESKVLLNPGTPYQFALADVQVAALAEGRVFNTFGGSSVIGVDEYIAAEELPCDSQPLANSLRDLFSKFRGVRVAYVLRARDSKGAKSVLIVYLDQRSDIGRLTDEVAAVAVYSELRPKIGRPEPRLTVLALVDDADSPAAVVAIAKFRATPFYRRTQVGGGAESAAGLATHEVNTVLSGKQIEGLEPDAVVFTCPFCSQKATVVPKTGTLTHEQPVCNQFSVLEPVDYMVAVNEARRSEGSPSGGGELVSLKEKRLEALLERVASDESAGPLLMEELLNARVFVPTQADDMEVMAKIRRRGGTSPTLQEIEPIPTWDLDGETKRCLFPIFSSLEMAKRAAGHVLRANWWSFPVRELLPMCKGREVCLNPGARWSWIISDEQLDSMIEAAVEGPSTP